jgi:hypothetical protein
MARTLLDLANDMDKLAGAVPNAASEHAKKVALTIVNDLAYHTPVDTSKALSNWIVTVGTSTEDKIGPHFPGKHGSTFSQSAAETVEAAKAVIATKQPGQSIFITNNLPYIRRLNEGYSQQVPAGFVERALLLARKMQAKFTLRK